MIIVNIQGRFGNQMFGFALYRQLVKMGKEVYVDLSHNRLDEQAKKERAVFAIEPNIDLFGFEYPVIDDEINIEINEADCRIDTYRASGAGGQHINKTDSAVRITHLPTGIVVSCQTQRSQFQNRDAAWKMLKARLYDIELQKREAEAQGIRDSQGDNGWGNQIRSYVLQPYTMVKDHRTDVETGNVDAVLDGSLDLLINGYLKWISTKQKETE